MLRCPLPRPSLAAPPPPPPPAPPLPQVRAAALEALDRTITGALNPELHVVPDKFTIPVLLLEPLPLPSTNSSGARPGPGLGPPAWGGAPATPQPSAPQPAAGGAAGAASRTTSGSGALAGVIIGGVQQSAQREDVQHMLLVALDSLYREDREPDVRRGLLKIVLHLLQVGGAVRCSAVLQAGSGGGGGGGGNRCEARRRPGSWGPALSDQTTRGSRSVLH